MSEPYYRVDPVEDGAETDWDETYDMLRGPDGFECLLTEPEDRKWYRDGAVVVQRLNEQHVEIERLTAEAKTLRRIPASEVWYWQGDDTDDLKSLTCPVIVEPEVLRALVAKIDLLAVALASLPSRLILNACRRIRAAENFAMAVDGPVEKTSRAMSEKDMEYCLKALWRCRKAAEAAKGVKDGTRT